LAAIGIPVDAMGGSGSLPDLATLPTPVREIIERAYGDGVAEIFLVAAPLGIVAIVSVLLLKEVPLGTRSGVTQRLEEELATPVGTGK
jgi:hypothetical protein